MPLLSEVEINEKLQALSGWSFENNSINKEFVFTDFRDCMSMMMRISYEAENINHHPDWSNVYNRLNISLNTHDSGGVTEKDFELANRIEKIIA